MRRLSLGVLLATFLSGATFAADLPVKAVAPPPILPTWTGFFLGLNSGYSFGSGSFD